MINKGQKFILFLIFLVIFLRIVLLFLPSFKIDIGDFQAWATKLVEGGPSKFYSANYFSDYFPGYLYILWFAGKIFKTIFPSISLFSNQFAIFLKLITNIFDLGTAFFIYKIIKKYSANWATIASLFYLGNPAIIFNSSVWGQVDGVMAFFLVLSIYLLVELKRIFLWSIVFSFAVLVKPQSLIILPLTLIPLKSFNRKQVILSIIFFVLSLFLISLPFFTKNPVFGLYSLFTSSTNVYPYTSLFAFNFWSIVGFWKPDNQVWLLKFYTWGIVLLILAILTSFFILVKSKKNKLLYLGVSLLFLSFFLFPTRIHERYLFPFFAFFLIASFIKKSYIFLGVYILISIIHFLNLFYVYFYYNITFNNPNPPNSLLYNFINSNYSLLSILTLISFGIILISFFKYHEDKSTNFLNSIKSSKMSKIKTLTNFKHWLILILLFSFFSRIFLIWYPNKYVFDEVYHGFTAIEYLKGSKAAWEWWTTPPPGVAYEWTHPPLAKEIMTASMFIFHSTDFWAIRLPGVIAGTFTVYLLFQLAYLLFKNKLIALFSAFIFSIDGLNFVQSRTGMNDIYFVVFMLATLVFYFRKNIFLSAAFAGLALASKWTGIYLIGFIFLIKIIEERDNIPKVVLNAFITLLALVTLLLPLIIASHSSSLHLETFENVYAPIQIIGTVALLILSVFVPKYKSWGVYLLIPSLIYIATYIPFFLLGHNYKTFISLQQQMWWYHTGLKAHHDYASPWWSWPLNLYPVWYFVDYHKYTISNIFASGNPAVFWVGSIAIALTIKEFIFNSLKKKINDYKGILISLLGFFVFWLPWALSPRIMFLYHFSPSTAFLSLILGYQLNSLRLKENQKAWVIVILVYLLVSFLLIYPMLVGIPLPKDIMLLFFRTNLTKNPFGS